MISKILLNIVYKNSQNIFELFVNSINQLMSFCQKTSSLHLKNFTFILFWVALLLFLSLITLLWNYKLRFELKKQLSKVHDNEAFINRIFEYSCTAIVVMDAQTYQFIDCNQAAVKIYGFKDKSDVLKCTPLEVSSQYQYDGIDSKTKAKYFLDIAKANNSVIFEWKHQRSDNSVWDAEVNLLYFSIDDNHFYQFSLSDITQKKKTELALIQSESLAKTVIDNSPIGISVRSATGQLLLYNKAWVDIWEISNERLNKDLQPRAELKFNERDNYFSDHHKEIKRIYTQGGVYFIPEFKTTGIFSKSGKPRYLSQHFTGITNSNNIVERVVILTNDITEFKESQIEKDKLQSQLNQAQKMESIGRLAGGVAHDFNNMLGVIIGYTELALMGIEDNHPIISHLNEINHAAKRSANLTRQLLGFARKQTIKPIVINLNEAISNMKKILTRLIHENIELIYTPSVETLFIKIDPSQLDQILANLCINARDAISNTGMIKIVIQKFIDHALNSFAMILVEDNGCGMTQNTIDHLFEPFFSTKEIGQGTGLGLANVYGIITQNNGFIEVESEENKGSIFKIYLPLININPEIIIDEKKDVLTNGKGEILLVEDEETLLKMTKDMLEMYGYRVYTANKTSQAISIAEKLKDQLQLLITDVIMPEMNGNELSIKINQYCPNIKKIFMSGYTANVIEKHGILSKDLNFLQKPFNIDSLISLVQKVLND